MGLAGDNPTLYGYVKDVNTLIDQLGLNSIPKGKKLIGLYIDMKLLLELLQLGILMLATSMQITDILNPVLVAYMERIHLKQHWQKLPIMDWEMMLKQECEYKLVKDLS